jgi:Flp pilus assembly protein TadG
LIDSGLPGGGKANPMPRLDPPTGLFTHIAEQRREKSSVRPFAVFLDEAGASMVEAAFSFVILLAVMFGIFQMSIALYSYHYVSEAAREATRYAAVRGSACSSLTNCKATSAQIQTYIRGIAFPGINSSNLSVTSTWLSASATQPTTWSACNNQCNAPGNEVKVVVTYSFPSGIPFLGVSTISVSSTSQMVISQ